MWSLWQSIYHKRVHKVILFHAFTMLSLFLFYVGKKYWVCGYMMYFPGALYIADRQTFLLLQKERIKRRWETGSCKEDVHYWKILSSKPICERNTGDHSSSAGYPCPVLVIHRVANTNLQNRFCAIFNFTSKFTFLFKCLWLYVLPTVTDNVPGNMVSLFPLVLPPPAAMFSP